MVAAAGIRRDDLVVEIGAGTGRLTAPLAAHACSVIAIELDPVLAAGLRRRFDGQQRVTVVEADALSAPLPERPYRIVANLPFSITTPLLRRVLDDPATPLLSADVVVQRGWAMKRTAARPSTLLSAGWSPWWELAVERILPPHCFQPPPAVESAIVSVRARSRPLVPAASAGSYRSMLQRAYRRDNRPVRAALRLERGRWTEFARSRGLAADARPTHLDAWDWAALFAVLHGKRA
jgi:23S rRNA (adenine-N6)-dimethyltransferase